MYKTDLSLFKDALQVLLRSSVLERLDVSLVHDGSNAYIEISDTGQYFFLGRISYDTIDKNDIVLSVDDIANESLPEGRFKREMERGSSHYGSEDYDKEEDDRVLHTQKRVKRCGTQRGRTHHCYR